MKQIDLQLKEFVPVLPIWTGHSQTLLGHLIPSDPVHGSTEKHILKLSDSDELLLEYINNKSKFTLSIFHGLGGDGQSDYMRRTANLALALGWNIVLVHHRLAHPEARAERSYHSGRGDDAEAVLLWARQIFKDSTQVAVGFSMSGSILLNLLTKRYGSHQPDFAICVNAPLKLDQAGTLLTKGFSKIYDIRFYLLLKKLINSQHDVELPFWGRTIDIDRLYTAQKNGFKDSQDYYDQCSTWPYVGRIQTPTFILTSQDDPFVDFESYQTAKWPECVHQTWSEFGGHMGYVSRRSDLTYGIRWLDYYLSTVFLKIQNDLMVVKHQAE